MIREISAGAVVLKREKGKIKYLLLQYGSKENPKHWGFPRGGIEKGENGVETAKREIKEETGIKELKFIPGFRKSFTWFYKRRIRLGGKSSIALKGRIKIDTVFKRAIFYLAETKSKEVKISSEHAGYAWLDYQQAIKQLTFKNAKNILKKANQFLLKYFLGN